VGRSFRRAGVGERVVESTGEEACMSDRPGNPESDPDHDTPETPEERAEELAHEAAEENPDPITYREVLEGELEEEGLSEEGSEIGEHID
jgi:hypothetical protein